MFFSYGIVGLNTIDLPFFRPRKQHKMSSTVTKYNRGDREKKEQRKN
jgi:hypothetical protein